MEDSYVQAIAIVCSNLIILLTFFGISISLHNGIREEIREIQKELKDFHGRMERQDANFKSFLMEAHANGNAKK